MTLCPGQLLKLTYKTILWDMCNKKQKTIDRFFKPSYSDFNIHAYEYRNFNEKTIILASFYSAIKYFFKYILP